MPILLSLLQWLQNLALFSWIRSSYGYPVFLALHLSSISVFGAMIVMSDLRLMGWGFRDSSIAGMIDRLRVPKRIGFLCAATFGFLIFGSKAEEYYYNASFRIKVSLFVLVAVHALVFRGSVYNNPAELDRMPEAPARAKLAAALSLLLWTGILCAGRGIGYLAGHAGIHYT